MGEYVIVTARILGVFSQISDRASGSKRRIEQRQLSAGMPNAVDIGELDLGVCLQLTTAVNPR